MLRLLFVHSNVPGQFLHLVRALAGRPDCELAAIGGPTARAVPGMRLERYEPPAENAPGIDPVAGRFVLDSQRGEATAQAAQRLRRDGFVPDIVVGHSGWGEMLYLRDVFPAARFVTYLEFFFRETGLDVGFDPEFAVPPSLAQSAALRARNATALLAAADADTLVTPTRWQASTFPPMVASRLTVLHEGVDTRRAAPHDGVRVELPNGQSVATGDEVLTYVARNLEPYRGFHVFMRALPEILARRPQAQVLVVGGDQVSYGMPHPSGRPWREVLCDEIAGAPGLDRVHFLGKIPYDAFLGVLQVSRVHVYLTYPFVLSWSMLEAMACATLLVGSRTAPVEEFVEQGRNGVLVDFFDTAALAAAVADGLSDASRTSPLRTAARATVLERCDLARHGLPGWLAAVGLGATG